MSVWQKIKAYLEGAEKIILVIHEKPDGDCLGSALALGHYLKSEGFKPLIFHPDPLPLLYRFLPGQEIINISKEKELPQGIPVIAVDCADPGRIYYDLPGDVPVINIDHHSSNNSFGDFNLVDAKAAATGELIFELLSETGKKISAEIATCLYVAISSDTGSFKYSNTTAKSFKIAGELLDLGAAIDDIRENLFEKHPLSELIILKLALTNMKLSLGGKIAWSVLTYEDLEKNNLLDADTESFISLLRSVEGVELAIVFKELEPSQIKVSFRSKNIVDVNILAHEFGGGGHARAAGCSLQGKIKEITQQVLQSAVNYLQESLLAGGDHYGRRT